LNKIVFSFEENLASVKDQMLKLVQQKTDELNNAEMLLRSSLESPLDMIILAIDKNYNYLYFNQAHKDSMKAAYGKTVSVGMNILDCISLDIDKTNSKKNYDLAMSGVSHSTIQEYGDKQKRYYESLYNPVYNGKKRDYRRIRFCTGYK